MKTKHNRKTKKNKTRSKRSKRMRGGGCGCDKPMIGGSANLAELPVRYYYQLNDEVHNPNYIKGGKKKMKGGMPDFLKGGKKKMKGGMPDFLIGGPLNSFGPANGIYQSLGMITGLPVVNSDPTVQPIINGDRTYMA
jgi:hypothetical protein